MPVPRRCRSLRRQILRRRILRRHDAAIIHLLVIATLTIGAAVNLASLGRW